MPNNEPTISDLVKLAEEWIIARDAIVNLKRGTFVVLTNDQDFVRTMNAFQRRALNLVGTQYSYELWEGLTEMLYMAKNSLPTPKG